MEKGRLKVNSKLSGVIKVGKKKFSVPVVYDLSPREKYNGQDCEFDFIDNKVTNLKVGGIPVPIDNELVKARIAKRERQAQRQEEAQQQLERSAKKAAIAEGDFFDLAATCAPKDTRALDVNGIDIDNYSLKLNRFAFYNNQDQKFKFFNSDRRKGISFNKPNFTEINFKDLATKQLALGDAIFDKPKADGTRYKNHEVLTFNLNWRMVVGLGHESVYETAITLHHIYGFPYIPASSIKGVLRSWIITQCFDKEAGNNTIDLAGAEERALNDKGFVVLFGNTETQGSITFLDAYPTQSPNIEPDVMNPHYGPYYGKKEKLNGDKEAPVDYHNPVPIPFLTVVNTPFQFIFGTQSTQTIETGKFAGKTNLAIIQKWLPQALMEHGIGAKTAVGYGMLLPK